MSDTHDSVVSDDDNPMLLKKKKTTYVQGELFPMEKESLLMKIKNWWDSLPVRPYVRTRDLNNGPDTNYENKSKTSYEVGIRISF